MLHLRLIVPADLSDEVVELIGRTVGTAHVVVLAGAARSPVGDVVMCDVAREAGDELIGALREMGIDDCGSITVENMDLTLSKQADEAERAAPGESADAVLWEELSEVTHEESTFSATYVAFLAVATMLAACGVMLDNTILIVGAMAVGPEFGPLAGISTALVQRAPRLVARSLWALIGGFAAAMLLTAGFAWLMDAFGLFDSRHGHRAPAQHGLHLAPGLDVVRGGAARGGRGDALPDVGEVRCADRRGDLGDHGARGRQRRGRLQLPGLPADLGFLGTAPGQPGRHRPRRDADPADPEGAVEDEPPGGERALSCGTRR